MATYRATSGAGYSHKAAQALGDVLESLGEFTPKDVVNAARPKDSPIHGLFEWDNRKAAEKYRITQARNHVNHLRIVIEESTGAVTKAFHSITIRHEMQPTTHEYMSMATVRGNDALREQVINKARAELRGWRDRYDEYREVFETVMEAIDEMAEVEAVA